MPATCYRTWQKCLPHFHPPIVVKADGLAAGKGVVIAQNKEEAVSVCAEMLSGRMLGEAGARVVLEEYLRAGVVNYLSTTDDADRIVETLRRLSPSVR